MITRRLSGTWGIISFTGMTIVIVGVLVLLDLPPVIRWCGSLLAGVLLLLRIYSVIRGTAKRSQRFSAFEHNTLGQPVTEAFLPPIQYDLDLSSDESVVALHAPVLRVMSGLGSLFRGGTWSFLGKGKTTDAENGLVLTQKRLLFLMIGPETLRRYCSSSHAARLLDALPGDAFAKRLMLWQAGASDVHDALAGLVAEQNLEQVLQTHFSFSIPLTEIRSVGYSLERHTVQLHLAELSLRYCLKSAEELGSLVKELRDLGVKIE
ncbi:MAG: hypothetical protein KQH59_05585 [Desulfobulbaceae bacterium]|nr:hypothetical protein [Desulfobulbaceae bacterium]